MTILSILLPIALLNAYASPDDPRGDEDRDLSLTIYSAADPARFDPRQFVAEQRVGMQFGGRSRGSRVPGYGVVRDSRAIELQEGENILRIADVAAEIDPTTVSFRSRTAPESTAVLEQSFEYDLVSSDKLLRKYLGKPITIRRESPTSGHSALTAPLLSNEPATSGGGQRLVLGGSSPGDPVRVIPLNDDIVEIELPDPGTELMTEPTLVWTVATTESGRHDVEISYQTGGLTWRADYNVVVNADETTADLGAWVTILNESGASYHNTKLKLVAGNVQQIEPEQEMMLGFGGMGGMGGGLEDEGFQEKAFFEYHLYTLGRRTSLPVHSTKQIELFPRRPGVEIEKVYVYYGLPADLRFARYSNPSTNRAVGTHSNTDVDVYLKIHNVEERGLGLPLPAGRVRVYKRDDADDALEFVGEDVIDHTPKGEEILSRLGSAFDLVGDRKQTSFERDGNNIIEESYQIQVRNRKDEPVVVQIRETLFRWSNWRILENSHGYEQIDSRTIHFPVEVPADGETTVDYKVQYTINQPQGGFR